MKEILITGANGFIGQNLATFFKGRPDIRITDFDIDSPPETLEKTLDVCDVIFHLAGVNRPLNEAEFESGNVGFLTDLLAGLERRNRYPLIALSSSTQALLDNAYGRSKKAAEEALVSFGQRTNSPIRIFRLPGVFGKWCRPDYNSVVATFCHRIARDIPIQISDPAREIEIIHVDDVIKAFVEIVDNPDIGADPWGATSPTFKITLSRLAEMLYSFKAIRKTLMMPDLSDPLTLRLFSTFQAYLPLDDLAYHLVQHADNRGVLAELFKSPQFGQVFVSRTHPGITRGRHAHNRKTEKFVVIEGEAIIRLRHMASGEIVEIPVKGRDFRVVDIPSGWAHTIENVGKSEMIVLFWSSEVFDPGNPDTFMAEVIR